MPIGLDVNNPQTQVAELTPTATGQTVTYGGNALGSGASTSTAPSTDLSTILIYGAIGLFAIWILQRIGD